MWISKNMKIMLKANKLLKEKKIKYEPKIKELIWNYEQQEKKTRKEEKENIKEYIIIDESEKMTNKKWLNFFHNKKERKEKNSLR